MNIQQLKQKYSRKHLTAVTGIILLALTVFFMAGMQNPDKGPTNKTETNCDKDWCWSSEAPDFVKDMDAEKVCASGDLSKENQEIYCVEGNR